ncbi:hypothetical protein FWK35_00002466 [Aphis craccivora]|uniref:Uncharacterized protein n=1 Tax=Aphis craccivora TaxID=307492 RepID=A0A6G0ZP01_APHCR|nr:hypothetical protein FWK35_00002466 [Aphis craccivora]
MAPISCNLRAVSRPEKSTRQRKQNFRGSFVVRLDGVQSQFRLATHARRLTPSFHTHTHTHTRRSVSESCCSSIVRSISNDDGYNYVVVEWLRNRIESHTHGCAIVVREARRNVG